PIQARLAHVPVRSAAQLISKVAIGLQTLRLKANRFPLEGFHWDLIFRLIRDKKYRLSDDDLRSIALTYSQLPTDAPGVVDEAGPRLGVPSDIVRYAELAEVNLAERMGSFIETLCQEVLSARKASAPPAEPTPRYAEPRLERAI